MERNYINRGRIDKSRFDERKFHASSLITSAKIHHLRLYGGQNDNPKLYL
nr:MAG TPA: hypothetical protein [Caudoviricetes sp.]DAO97990.1 MAG TPA: hypothetical protein [Caudoviricetes sp.]